MPTNESDHSFDREPENALEQAMDLARSYVNIHADQNWKLLESPDLRQLPDPHYFALADSYLALPQTTHLYVLAQSPEAFLVIHLTAITAHAVGDDRLFIVEKRRLGQQLRADEHHVIPSASPLPTEEGDKLRVVHSPTGVIAWIRQRFGLGK